MRPGKVISSPGTRKIIKQNINLKILLVLLFRCKNFTIVAA